MQQYLSQYPVNTDDVVHLEGGGWVNPDGDFGSPQCLQWNYPLQPKNAQVNNRDAVVCTNFVVHVYTVLIYLM